MKETNFYDLVCAGPVSLDTNVACDGITETNLGGAVIYGAWAADSCGFSTAVVTRANPEECDPEAAFAGSHVFLSVLPSRHTCQIRNQYLTEDKEKRVSTNTHTADPIRMCDIEDMAGRTKALQLGGLVAGDIDPEILKDLHDWKQSKAKEGSGQGPFLPIIGIDAQGLLRTVEPDGSMKFHPWKDMERLLPYVDVLKTDAAEAEFLTGISDRRKAASLLHSLGAKEVMVTHNTEVIVCGSFEDDEIRILKEPLVPRNLSGRTGRGDTTFAGYLAMRTSHTAELSLRFAAALVSRKMEQSGPYKGTSEEILNYIHRFYE